MGPFHGISDNVSAAEAKSNKIHLLDAINNFPPTLTILERNLQEIDTSIDGQHLRIMDTIYSQKIAKDLVQGGQKGAIV